MERTHELKAISDDELLRRLAELLRQSRRVEADLVAHIGEVDERRLYAREASPSMFAYCTEVLRLSEAEAYLRIAAARASREHPVLLAMLADGRLHLTGIAKLAPHLSPDNRDTLLARAAHRSKRDIEELIAELLPRPDVPAVMRRLPERRVPIPPPPSLLLGPDGVAPGLEARPGGIRPALELRPDGVAPASGPQLSPDGVVAAVPRRQADESHGPVPSPVALPRPARLEPLAPARYRVQFTASAELRDKLERLQTLMRSSVPDGDLAVIIEQAVTEKLERLESRRFAQAKAPRKALATTDTSPKARRIPAAVRRAVYERDGGRCRYVDEQGRRCTARDGLEFHHRHPFGQGGDHSVENVSLLCRVHNRHLAEADYGRTAMAVHRRSRKRLFEATPSPSR